MAGVLLDEAWFVLVFFESDESTIQMNEKQK